MKAKTTQFDEALAFRCPHCDNRFEVDAEGDAYHVPCPQCGKELDLTELDPAGDDTPPQPPSAQRPAGAPPPLPPRTDGTGASAPGSVQSTAAAFAAKAKRTANSFSSFASKFSDATTKAVENTLPSGMTGTRKSILPGRAPDMDDCAAALLRKYTEGGYGAQVVSFEENGEIGKLVQIKNSTTSGGGFLRAATGLSSCATVKLTRSGNDLSVEVMSGKWLDKMGAAVVSWFVLWPLLFTAAIGAFRQKAFLDKVFSETMTLLASLPKA